MKKVFQIRAVAKQVYMLLTEHKPFRWISVFFSVLVFKWGVCGDRRLGGYVFTCVYLFVGWFGSRITQKIHNGFPWDLDGGWVSAQNRPHSLRSGQMKEFLTISLTSNNGCFSTIPISFISLIPGNKTWILIIFFFKVSCIQVGICEWVQRESCCSGSLNFWVLGWLDRI